MFIILQILDRPVTYLYNTLHYYERKLRERPPLKRTLVSAVLGSLKDVRASGWGVSENFQNYLNKSDQDATTWLPELNYYMTLFKRMVDSKFFVNFTFQKFWF